MKVSEAPMMTPMLCKNAKASWSEVFEIMKLGMSPNGRAVYVRVMFGMPGMPTECQHYWRDTEDVDNKWEIIDVLSGENSNVPTVR